MKNIYYVFIRFDNTEKEIFTHDYLLAWECYRMACATYPEQAIIDLVDGSTGEVFQCNHEWD